MYNRGRHDSHTRAHQESRYHLRQGIAICAEQIKATGEKQVDCVGRPMQYSNEMAERHGMKTVAKWARGARMTAVMGGMDFCHDCHKVPEHCTCEEG